MAFRSIIFLALFVAGCNSSPDKTSLRGASNSFASADGNRTILEEAPREEEVDANDTELAAGELNLTSPESPLEDDINFSSTEYYSSTTVASDDDNTTTGGVQMILKSMLRGGGYYPNGNGACGSPIYSLDECARAATALWPAGFGPPCTYPVWRNNIVYTNEPNNPKGCMLLRSGANGCGLRYNGAGRGSRCFVQSLSCTMVCKR